jgi:hypothetical protein
VASGKGLYEASLAHAMCNAERLHQTQKNYTIAAGFTSKDQFLILKPGNSKTQTLHFSSCMPLVAISAQFCPCAPEGQN